MFIAVAIIFSIFAFSFIYAVLEEPEYNDYCMNQAGPRYAYTEPSKEYGSMCGNDTYAYPTEVEQKTCNDQDGQMQRKTDAQGCPAEYYCETCQKGYDDANSEYKLWVFLIACLFAILAIVLGITTPLVKGEFAEIIGPGFIIGGLITLFIGTAMYFDAMNRVIRPIVMFIELVIVLYLIYWAVKKKK